MTQEQFYPNQWQRLKPKLQETIQNLPASQDLILVTLNMMWLDQLMSHPHSEEHSLRIEVALSEFSESLEVFRHLEALNNALEKILETVKF